MDVYFKRSQTLCTTGKSNDWPTQNNKFLLVATRRFISERLNEKIARNAVGIFERFHYNERSKHNNEMVLRKIKRENRD